MRRSAAALLALALLSCAPNPHGEPTLPFGVHNVVELFGETGDRLYGHWYAALVQQPTGSPFCVVTLATHRAFATRNQFTAHLDSRYSWNPSFPVLLHVRVWADEHLLADRPLTAHELRSKVITFRDATFTTIQIADYLALEVISVLPRTSAFSKFRRQTTPIYLSGYHTLRPLLERPGCHSGYSLR